MLENLVQEFRSADNLDIIADEKIKVYVRGWENFIKRVPTDRLRYAFIDARIQKHKAGEKGAITAIDVLNYWNLDGRYVHTFLPVSQHGLPKLYKNGESYWPQKKCGKGTWATGIPIRDEGYTDEELDAIRPLVVGWMKFVESMKPAEKSQEEQLQEMIDRIANKQTLAHEVAASNQQMNEEDLPF